MDQAEPMSPVPYGMSMGSPSMACSPFDQDFTFDIRGPGGAGSPMACSPLPYHHSPSDMCTPKAKGLGHDGVRSISRTLKSLMVTGPTKSNPSKDRRGGSKQPSGLSTVSSAPDTASRPHSADQKTPVSLAEQDDKEEEEEEEDDDDAEEEEDQDGEVEEEEGEEDGDYEEEEDGDYDEEEGNEGGLRLMEGYTAGQTIELCIVVAKQMYRIPLTVLGKLGCVRLGEQAWGAGALARALGGGGRWRASCTHAA